MAVDPDQLIRSREVARAADPTGFYRAARRGEFLRLAPAVYVPTARWAALDADERHRMRVLAAVAASRSETVVGYRSAALM
ncbi:MAG: hypothetical protein QM635_11095 [Microbacteriaceae bacterium]